jgi:hypothetical protein
MPPEGPATSNQEQICAKSTFSSLSLSLWVSNNKLLVTTSHLACDEGSLPPLVFDIFGTSTKLENGKLFTKLELRMAFYNTEQYSRNHELTV